MSWYARIKGVAVEVQLLPIQSQGPVRETINVLFRNAQDIGSRLVNYYRDLVSASLATFSEKFEAKLRFRRALFIAKHELAYATDPSYLEPFQQRTLVPGKRLLSLSDSRLGMEPYAKQVREMITNLSTSI